MAGTVRPPAGHLPGPLGRLRQPSENPALRFLAPAQTLELNPSRRRAARRPARPARRGQLRRRRRHRRDRHRRPAGADARRDRVPDRGHGRPTAPTASRAPRSISVGPRPPRSRAGSPRMPAPRRRRRRTALIVTKREPVSWTDRRRQLRRGDLAARPQVDDHLRRDPRDRADDPAARAQAPGPLPGPLRAQPGRSRGPDPAARRRRQAAQQGELQARGGGADPLGDRPGARHPQRHRDAGDHPVRRRRRRQGRPLRDRRLDRHPLRVRLRLDLVLRPAARRLVVGLEVQLHGRDALGRAADLLRDLDGPRAARRDHDGRLAQPRRHRQRPGRRPSGTSSPSSSAS